MRSAAFGGTRVGTYGPGHGLTPLRPGENRPFTAAFSCNRKADTSCRRRVISRPGPRNQRNYLIPITGYLGGIIRKPSRPERSIRIKLRGFLYFISPS